jgi:hypothetical protein
MAGAGSDRARSFAPHFSLNAHEASRDARLEGDVRSSGEDMPEFVELEDWDFEETMRHVRQLVQSVTSGSGTDTGQPVRDGGSSEPQLGGGDAASGVESPVRPSGTLPWLILALGLGVFACGAALMGLSLARHSTPLWQLGLPMVLSGQLAVLFVVIWQLDVVWHSNRATFVALHAMDEQLRQLRLLTSHVPANHVSLPAGSGLSGTAGTASGGASIPSSGASNLVASGPPNWAALPRNL